MKEKILNEARILYNQHGLSKVTARAICNSLGISLGSFSYHFPDKKKILLSLYEQMLRENQGIYDWSQKQAPSIILYLEMHKKLFLIQSKYKFFFLNIFEILTNNADIQERYIRNLLQGREMAKQVLKYYMEVGIVNKHINEEQIDRMINVGQILNNFWTIDSEISPVIAPKDQMTHYMKICCGLLEPYLRPASREAYRKYFDELNEN